MNFEVIRPIFKEKVYNVLDFGAKSSANFNNQKFIQKAIDECNNNGGGTVLVPNGYFLTGPIQIKSNVNFHLDNNAFIQFTKSKEDYPLIWSEYEGTKRIRATSPIWAKDASNIAITGNGIIDGNGFLWRGVKKWKLTEREWNKCLQISPYVLDNKEGGIWCPTQSYYEGILKGEPDYDDPNALAIASQNYDVYRPVLVSLINCDKVLIDGVTLQNSPAWNVHPLYCTNFTMINASIKNKYSAQNGDGLDLESCQNCEIGNCVFEVGDDGICMKSGKNKEARKIKVPTKNVWIHDCKVFNAHGGFVVGSEMSRGVSNILVENCTFYGTDIGIRFKSALGRGGVVEDITIRNINMANIIEEAIIFTMGYVLTTMEDNKEKKEEYFEEDIPEFKNIKIENVECLGAKMGLKILGLPNKFIHDISISNSNFYTDKDIDLMYSENINLDNVNFYN